MSASLEQGTFDHLGLGDPRAEVGVTHEQQVAVRLLGILEPWPCACQRGPDPAHSRLELAHAVLQTVLSAPASRYSAELLEEEVPAIVADDFLRGRLDGLANEALEAVFSGRKVSQSVLDGLWAVIPGTSRTDVL